LREEIGNKANVKLSVGQVDELSNEPSIHGNVFKEKTPNKPAASRSSKVYFL